MLRATAAAATCRSNFFLRMIFTSRFVFCGFSAKIYYTPPPTACAI